MKRLRLPAILFSFLMCFILVFQVLPMGVGTVVAATDWYVATTGDDVSGDGSVGNPWQTIGYAVANASVQAADTINVAAGTYVLDSQVNLTKADLTLAGAGSASTIVQVSGTGERFYITAAGVTINGFGIQKTDDNEGVQNIIYIGASDVSITNNEISGQYVFTDPGTYVSRAMVFTGGLTGLNISGNTIHHLRQPAYISGVTTGAISSNYVYRTRGWVLEQGNMTFTGNTWGTGPNANVYDIAILSSVSSAYYGDILAMAAANNGAVIEDQRVSPAVLSVVYVDGSVTSSGLGTPASPKKTIAEGITRIVAGGTVNVAAGTYQEQLDIGKNLTLTNGMGSPVTVLSLDSLATKFTSSAANKPVIYVHDAANVIIRDITVDGAGKGNANYRMEGIAFYNAGGTVQDCIIKDIRETPLSGTQHGVGIYVYNSDGVARTISIQDNDIYGYQKNGMALTGANMTANVGGNTVTGAGPTGVIAQNGIQISYGASGTIGNYNTVSGNYWTGTYGGTNDPVSDPEADGSAGICLYGSNSVTVQNNTLTANQFGLWSVAAASLDIQTNTITGTSDQGYAFVTGIAVWDSDMWTATLLPSPVSTVASISNSNVITSTHYGILIMDYTLADGYQPAVTASGNDISGNSGYGAWANVAVDATNNWWGNATGPYNASTNPGGLGDPVSANVSFIPWTGMTAPTVTSATPNQGDQGQTLTGVVIAGTNFVGVLANGVSFGSGITVNSFTVNSATQITASISIGAGAVTGTRDVSVTNYMGTGTASDAFTVNTVGGPPAAPTLVSPDNGVMVTGISVTYEWTAVDGAVNYRLIVSRSTNPLDTTMRKISVLVGNTTTYVDTGYPANGTKYYWWVWAINADGEQSPWEDVSANGRWFTNGVYTGPPPAPTLVSPDNGAAITGTSVTFEWNSVAGAVNYRLIVSTSTNPLDTTKRKISTLVGNTTTYTDTGYPANGTKYYWWVWAVNPDGTQSPFVEVSANGRWFTNIPSIGAPTLVSPANGAVVPGNSVTFEWNSVAGAVDYRLMVSTSTNPLDTTKRKISTLVGNTTTYTDTGYPANGTKYYWWVWAVNADGEQSLWSQVSANGRWFTNTAAATIPAPTLVSPANGATVTGTSVTFQWNAVAGAVNYRLMVSTSTDITDTTKRKISILVGNVTTYVDTGYPANGTKYYWWVWAINADGGQSLWSDVSPNGRWFTNTSTYIAAPTLVSPDNGATVSGTSVTFQWSAVAEAVSYRIIVSTSTNPLDTTKTKVNILLGNVTTYVDTGYPANGTKYYWWVWAINADGSQSVWSEVSANMRSLTSVA